MRATIAALAATVLLVGCGGGSGEPADESEPTTDPLGQRACESFRELQLEAETMTEADLADGVAELYREWGRYTETPAIARASRAMQVAVVDNDTDAFGAAVRKMGRACERVGH